MLQYYAEDQLAGGSIEDPVIDSWKGASLNEIVTRDPFLTFAVLFLCLRAFACIFLKVLFSLKAFFVSSIHHLNMTVFDGTSQFMGQVLHMIDVRSAWDKLRLCKTQKLHTRVWASSLASVSLGKSSSPSRAS